MHVFQPYIIKLATIEKAKYILIFLSAIFLAYFSYRIFYPMKITHFFEADYLGSQNANGSLTKSHNVLVSNYFPITWKRHQLDLFVKEYINECIDSLQYNQISVLALDETRITNIATIKANPKMFFKHSIIYDNIIKFTLNGNFKKWYGVRVDYYYGEVISVKSEYLPLSFIIKTNKK